jgi:hypothetical protein
MLMQHDLIAYVAKINQFNSVSDNISKYDFDIINIVKTFNDLPH